MVFGRGGNAFFPRPRIQHAFSYEGEILKLTYIHFPMPIYGWVLHLREVSHIKSRRKKKPTDWKACITRYREDKRLRHYSGAPVPAGIPAALMHLRQLLNICSLPIWENCSPATVRRSRYTYRRHLQYIVAFPNN